jgi:hypothetical protein
MTGMLLCLFSDSTAVNIRALVSQDISKATSSNSASAGHTFVERMFGVSEFVLIVELAMILVMAGLFITLVIRFRRMAKEQKRKLAAEQRMSVKRPPSISRTEIERILNQIASEKTRTAEASDGSYFVDYSGRLDSGAAIHEMARTHRMESERLNFAISTASQTAKQGGTKFKEAFTLVSEDSDLNVLARQLNMGRGELELILALKKSKIANSKKLSGNDCPNGSSGGGVNND